MEAYLLSDYQIATSVERAEAGMGYQPARVGRQEGYIVASKVFVPITTSSLGQTNGPQYYTKDLAVLAPEPTHKTTGDLMLPQILNRYESLRRVGVRAPSASKAERPENETLTTVADFFYRVTAYLDDRRIRPDKSLAPESYSTTDTDLKVVPSGLAAVGRFALPTRISARHVFQIKPGKGVRILFGTVIPNHGLCGGGVEVFFLDGTGPGSVSYSRTLPEE